MTNKDYDFDVVVSNPSEYIKMNDVSVTTLNSQQKEKLKSFIDKIEKLENEKIELGETIKSIYALLKTDGFDVKAVRQVVKLLLNHPEALQEREAELTLVETYMAALGFGV